MEYYSAIKGNKIPTYATTWMNLENVMLSERTQTQKVTYSIVVFLEIFRRIKSIGTEC